MEECKSSVEPLCLMDSKVGPIHPLSFSSLFCWSGSHKGSRYPEDPLTATSHGGSSHLLNLDFLKLPGF